eukprot:TRINITY_DN15504_c0_g1_i1.p1 TRINITY_DN15504_c0_g1~~TRINITY_DN15504_c0_g1_i1.p1  ORF type:complete len:312 (-),score=59.07 TRINITY_DN15504_c0_g1_i1:85-996(-)
MDPYLANVLIVLHDQDERMMEAWRVVFQEYTDVWSGLNEEEQSVTKDHFKVVDSVKDTPVDAFVFPCTSSCFAVSETGQDLLNVQQFGYEIYKMQERVVKENFGEILVGEAIVEDITTPIDETNKYLIAVPTTRVPMDIKGTVNAYLAFRALLLEVRKHNKSVSDGVVKASPIKCVLCPGLGITVGGLPPLTCAVQMLQAYQAIGFGKPPSQITMGHKFMALSRKVGQEDILRQRKTELAKMQEAWKVFEGATEEDSDDHHHHNHDHDHHHEEGHVCRGMVRYPSDFSSSSEEYSDPYDIGVC